MLFIFSFFFILNTYQQDYSKAFGDDYINALSFCKENKKTLCDYASINQAEKEVIISALFPELIRYSLLKDFFETAALELIYVQKGSKFADFSIGQFQMKPSFAENIERYIDSFQLSNDYKFLQHYQSTDEKNIRKERITRLKTFRFQIIYANCLYQIVSRKFVFFKNLSKEDKIIFFASAYNHGFNCSASEIQKWSKIKFFPYGKSRKKINQYSYCDVAVNFYKIYYPKIFHNGK